MVLAIVTGAAGLMLGGLLSWLRRGWVLVTVEGRSMLPALGPGDRVLVRRSPPTSIQVGQVVVIEKPLADRWNTPPLAKGAAPAADRRWIVKRIVAGPGDPVPADVVAAVPARDGAGTGRGEADIDRAAPHVPAGCFVLLGDNRDGSFDSRTFGLVPGPRILGPVRLRMRTRRPLG